MITMRKTVRRIGLVLWHCCQSYGLMIAMSYGFRTDDDS